MKWDIELYKILDSLLMSLIQMMQVTIVAASMPAFSLVPVSIK